MRAVGIYIYAGGFSLGVRKHFDIVAHLEDPKPYGEKVIRMNPEYWGDMPVHPHPEWPNYDVDMLYANPPCAPFSNANTRSFQKDSWRNDPRISCWHNTASYAIKNDIPFVAIETVPQAYSKAPTLLMEKAEEFAWEGYECTIFLHNAMFMGSCQNRPRLMFIASKTKLKLAGYHSIPNTTVGDKLEEGMGLYKGADDFFINCSEKYRSYLPEIKQGERLRDTWERLNPEETWERNSRGQVKGRPTFGVKRVQNDKQMNVIVGYTIVHPDEHRYLTVKEYQTLGDYPTEYILPKSQTSLPFVARGVSASVGDFIGKTAKLTLEAGEAPNLDKLHIINGLQGKGGEYTQSIEIGPNIPLPTMGLRSKGFK